jgi:hypothetical protein
MVDGRLSTKWEVATVQNPCPHSVVFDMGELKEVDRFKVFNSPSNPDVAVDGGMDRYNDKNTDASTYDFDISFSDDNETWSTRTIRGNTSPITDIRLDEAVKARYIRITVITPNRTFLAPTNFWDTTNRIRILELQALVSVQETVPPVSLHENGEKLPSLSAALGKTVDVKVNIGGMETGAVNVIAATYNDAGVLRGLKQVTVDVDGTGVVNCAIPGFAVSQDTATMKVFFWTYDTFIPISEAVTVK